MAQDITEAEVTAITQSILTRYGIDFTCYEPKSLRRRIIRVMNNFNFSSAHDLWVQFLRDTNFVHVFMNEISVGMTSMFRDPLMWKNLKTQLAGRHELAIWHAGCSTGEEVYSMAIVLKELNLLDRAKALATDFNQQALEEAKAGTYHKIKMIENEANYKEYNMFKDFTQFFTTDGRHAKMDSSLISHVTFRYHNLVTDAYPKGFDIIFCRNVMIYFDSIAKLKMMDWFHQSLNPNGLFIIGFFDTMSHLVDNSKFELVDEAAKIFRKR